MEILKSDTNSKQEHITNKENISIILDEIILICKNDKTIFNNENIIKLEAQEDEIKNKIVKQEGLITESRNIERTLELKTNEINEYIKMKRSELLTSLGSEE